MPAQPYLPSYAAYWNNTRYSDTQLTLRTSVIANGGAPSPQASGGSTSSSTAAGAHVEEGGACRSAGCTHLQWQADWAGPADSLDHGARTYSLHAMTLSSASGYFKARVERCDSAALTSAAATCDAPGSSLRSTGETGVAAARCAGGPAASGTLLQLIEHVEEGELDAMEAVLRHCYTGQLCDNGADAAGLNVHTLLDMMALSDRFDVPTCLEHSLEELAGRSAAAYTVPTINRVLSDCTRGWHSQPAFARVVAAATERLLQLLGDVEALSVEACFAQPTSSAPVAHLQGLSLPSLLVLLSSQHLRARSDNSVLVMANSWDLAGVLQNGLESMAESRVKLAGALRLGHLSLSYVVNVLPTLPWLTLTRAEQNSLAQFAAAAPHNKAAGLSALQRIMVSDGSLQGSPAWWAAAPPQWPVPYPPLELQSEITSAELAQMLRDWGSKQKIASPMHLFNGFWMWLSVYFDGPDRHTVQPGDTPVAAHVCLTPSMMPCDAHPLVHVSARIGVLRADGGWDDMPLWTGFVEANVGSLALHLDLLPRSSQLLSLGGWAPYLVNGAVHMRCTVYECS